MVYSIKVLFQDYGSVVRALNQGKEMNNVAFSKADNKQET